MKRPGWFWYQTFGIAMISIPSLVCLWLLSFVPTETDPEVGSNLLTYVAGSALLLLVGYILTNRGERKEQEDTLRKLLAEVLPPSQEATNKNHEDRLRTLLTELFQQMPEKLDEEPSGIRVDPKLLDAFRNGQIVAGQNILQRIGASVALAKQRSGGREGTDFIVAQVLLSSLAADVCNMILEAGGKPILPPQLSASGHDKESVS